jgi:hypothetical protein
MVRQPSVAIPKDIHTRCDLSRKDVFDSWCNAMRHGGLALAGNIPLYTTFYRCFPFSTTSVNQQELNALTQTGFYYLSHGMKTRDEVHPRTRASFMLAFGVTPPEQRAIEA